MRPQIRRRLRAGLMPSALILSSLLLAGCGALFHHSHRSSASKAAPPAPTLVATAEAARSPVEGETRVNGLIKPAPGPDRGPIVVERGRDGTVGAPPSHSYVSRDGDVTLNYVDADIAEIARAILGEILKVNYTIDSSFHGQATIHTTRPLRREELLPTLQSLVAQAGGTIVYQNGIFRITASDNDTVIPPLVDGASVTLASELVPLRFASAKQLASVLEPYVGGGARILADPTRNVLVVTGSAPARQSLVDLIKVFDVDYLAGRSYALFPVKTGDPAKMVSDLQAALQLDSEGAMAGQLSIIPVEQANAIMVIAQQPIYLDRAAHLIAQLDQVRQNAGRNLHVYYLKNAQATNLQPLLQQAVNPPASGGGTGGETAPGNLPPTAAPARVSSSSAGTASPAAQTAAATSTGGTGQTASVAVGATQTAAQPLQSGAEASTPQVAGAANGPQIIADEKNNALIIVATESEYATIEAAVRKLDVMPMQVLIEATVAEVTLNDSLQYGTQYFLTHHGYQATLTNAQSLTPTVIDPTAATPITNSSLFPGLLAAAFPGFAIAKTGGSAQFALEALKSVTDVQVISAPKLLILDNEEARLQVGDLVPIITQSATAVTAAGAPVVNSIQYQETGVILSVKPRVNSGGLVTLDISQQVSNVIPTTTSTINSPTFQQRKIESKIVVQDGETISLAGLISDKSQDGKRGVPVLQDIPVLGVLFSTKDHSAARTELLVLITPRVMYNQSDARALTEELRAKLAPSRLVP
jgi:general secretion pathway protein D